MFSDNSMISRVGSSVGITTTATMSTSAFNLIKSVRRHKAEEANYGVGMHNFFGPGDLCRITGTLNANPYLEALVEYVLSTFAWYGMDLAISIFPQYNSRVNTANAVHERFAEQEFIVLEWPSNSPDLNIIEHVWSYIKQRLPTYKQAPQNMAKLWNRLQDICTSISSGFLRKLYESIPSRMKAPLRSRGGYIILRSHGGPDGTDSDSQKIDQLIIQNSNELFIVTSFPEYVRIRHEHAQGA